MRQLKYFIVVAALAGWQGTVLAQEQSAEPTEEVKANADAAQDELAEAEAKKKGEEAESEEEKKDEAAKKEEEQKKQEEQKQEGEQPAAPAPAPEPAPAPAFEEVKAAPVGGAADAASVGTSVKVEEDKDKKDDKPFGVSVTLEHSVGTAAFARNGYVRGSSRYIGQSWNVQPKYAFDFMGHRLTLSGRASLEIELTTPDSNPARRVSPKDMSIGLSDKELYKEPVTEISFNGGARYTLPTSYESINVKRQWAALSLSGKAARSIGPVDLGYSLAVAKYFNSSHVPLRTLSVARESLTSQTDPTQLGAGKGLNSFSITNTVDAGWNITEQLSLSYSLGLVEGFKYRAAPAERDEYTSILVDPSDLPRTEMWNYSIEVGYDLSNFVNETIVQLPFSLSAAFGVAASHSAQTANNSIMWPVFAQAFGGNRAGDNLGSVYLSLTGSY